MWPDSPFAVPIGSFRGPVVPPDVDPDASPTLSVSLNCAWLPYIRGALQQLVLQTTWQAEGAALDLVQARAMTLIGMFQECDAALPFSCPFDFTTGDNGFGVRIASGYTPATLGFYVAASGFQNSHQIFSDGSHWGYVSIVKLFDPAIMVSHIDFTFDLTKGTYDTDSNGFIFAQLAGATQIDSDFLCNTHPDGTGFVFAWDGSPVSIDRLELQLNSEAFPGGFPGTPGYAFIHEVNVNGVGRPGC